ncbi:hypothetical protein DY000_02007720 [Brassica cretica]|uniref:Uncharacterized protein n=1 Tax=Brassica cretica TaxID=69181 RepID=A0ABQ7CGU8_BRACR|nr:hypothetical protein DY000_02007720 [Brassica cretica]
MVSDGERCVVGSSSCQSALEIELDAKIEVCEDQPTWKSGYLDIELVAYWDNNCECVPQAGYRPLAFLELSRDRVHSFSFCLVRIHGPFRHPERKVGFILNLSRVLLCWNRFLASTDMVKYLE